MPRTLLLWLLVFICGCWLAIDTGVASPEGERLLDAHLPRFEPGPPLQGGLHSVGSDSMDVITFHWIQLFRQIHPQVRVTMEARSSLTAAPALTTGLADMAPIGRELLPSELAMFRQKFGYDPLLIRVGSGSYATDNRTHALAVYVHRDNPLRGLTLAQLDAIFSTSNKRGHSGDIKTWGDLGLGGEWHDRPITLYAMRRPNGIVNFFQQRVLLGGEFKTTIRERTNSNDKGALSSVVESLENDPGGIGYAGFSHALPGVRAVELAEESAGPFVAGTPESVADRTYPLARWIYIAVNKPPGQALPPNVREFLRLVLSREGQRIVAQDGAYLPLSAEVVREEQARLE
ncbi:MAG: substrate-binding domain-containing protein [Opitutaceae bacterium]|nr:substrate-binding domain-containing protein [Opitutaceae bacterium]